MAATTTWPYATVELHRLIMPGPNDSFHEAAGRASLSLYGFGWIMLSLGGDRKLRRAEQASTQGKGSNPDGKAVTRKGNRV